MMIRTKRKLIIAPHVDDEVLGMGGLLDNSTHVLHLGLAANQRHGDTFFSREERIAEWSLVQNETGCSSHLLDFPVNKYSFSDLITPIEQEINNYRPDIVFIPTPSYNQDHQAVYKASIVATRPHDVNHCPSSVLAYIQPQDIWPSLSSSNAPSVYIPVDIDRHIFLYTLLSSQIRSYRSAELIRAQLRIFGSNINTPYALGFVPHRLTLD